MIPIAIIMKYISLGDNEFHQLQRARPIYQAIASWFCTHRGLP